MDSRAFNDGLLKAYRGERAAVVTLRCLQEQALSGEEGALAELLVAIETMVGDRLEPLVRRRGLPVSLDEGMIEEARARARGLADWPGVVASLGERLEEYVAAFRALRNAAPAVERQALDLLVDHEIALIRFGALLREGRGEEARKALRSLLSADAGPSVRSSEKAVRAKLDEPPGAA